MSRALFQQFVRGSGDAMQNAPPGQLSQALETLQRQLGLIGKQKSSSPPLPPPPSRPYANVTNGISSSAPTVPNLGPKTGGTPSSAPTVPDSRVKSGGTPSSAPTVPWSGRITSPASGGSNSGIPGFTGGNLSGGSSPPSLTGAPASGSTPGFTAPSLGSTQSSGGTLSGVNFINPGRPVGFNRPSFDDPPDFVAGRNPGRPAAGYSHLIPSPTGGSTPSTNSTVSGIPPYINPYSVGAAGVGGLGLLGAGAYFASDREDSPPSNSPRPAPRGNNQQRSGGYSVPVPGSSSGNVGVSNDRTRLGSSTGNPRVDNVAQPAPRGNNQQRQGGRTSSAAASSPPAVISSSPAVRNNQQRQGGRSGGSAPRVNYPEKRPAPLDGGSNYALPIPGITPQEPAPVTNPSLLPSTQINAGNTPVPKMQATSNVPETNVGGYQPRTNATPIPTQAGEQTFEILDGATLYSMAGGDWDAVRAIQRRNNIADPNKIYAGDSIIIPEGISVPQRFMERYLAAM